MIIVAPIYLTFWLEDNRFYHSLYSVEHTGPLPMVHAFKGEHPHPLEEFERRWREAAKMYKRSMRLAQLDGSAWPL